MNIEVLKQKVKEDRDVWREEAGLSITAHFSEYCRGRADGLDHILDWIRFYEPGGEDDSKSYLFGEGDR